MAKAARGGYDGKGTLVLKDIDALAQLIRSVRAEDWMLEAWVNFERELALVVSRDASGSVRAFPLVETHQSQQVCDWVLAPAAVPQAVEALAYNAASSLLTKLNYVGVMALEFFHGPMGLQVNEIAPRTHNSGHFSIDACSSSQSPSQHLRLSRRAAHVLHQPNLHCLGCGQLSIHQVQLDGSRMAHPLSQAASE